MANYNATSLYSERKVADPFAAGERMGGAISNIIGGISNAWDVKSNEEKVNELIRLYNGRKLQGGTVGDVETLRAQLEKATDTLATLKESKAQRDKAMESANTESEQRGQIQEPHLSAPGLSNYRIDTPVDQPVDPYAAKPMGITRRDR